MKKFLYLGLVFGFLIIVALGGYVIYRVEKTKIAVQDFLNHSLSTMQNAEIQLDFDSFRCDGLFHIECKSSKIDVFYHDIKLFVLSNPKFALKNFDLKALGISFSASVRDIDLLIRNFASHLFPQEVKMDIQMEQKQDEQNWINIQSNLFANDFIYQIGLLMCLDKTWSKKNILNSLVQTKAIREKFFLTQVELKVSAKKQRFNMEYQNVESFMWIARNVYLKNRPFLKNLDQALIKLSKVFSGSRESVLINLENPIGLCLMCRNKEEEIYKFLQQSKIQVD